MLISVYEDETQINLQTYSNKCGYVFTSAIRNKPFCVSVLHIFVLQSELNH